MTITNGGVAQEDRAAYQDGVRVGTERGRAYQKDESLRRLQDYFDLTQFSEKHEGAEPNPEWDRGFQAAMAVLKGDGK